MCRYAGDAYYRPMQVQGSWLDYTGCVMSVDQVVKERRNSLLCYKILRGNIYLVDIGGFNSGYSEHTLSKLVEVAKHKSKDFN